jgi:hypothetical protein
LRGVQLAQERLSQYPIIKHVAWAVTPLALGYAAVKAHEYIEPIVSRDLLPKLADVPVLKHTVNYPFATTGVVAGLALGMLAKRGLVNRSAAAALAASAVSVGVALDARRQKADMGALAYGDGGQYMIGRQSTALGAIDMNGVHMGALDMGAIHQNPVHMGAVDMGSIQMAGVHDSVYGDASLADAKACNCVMMPDEVAAAKAGKMAYVRKFGLSPKNLKTGQSLTVGS